MVSGGGSFVRLDTWNVEYLHHQHTQGEVTQCKLAILNLSNIRNPAAYFAHTLVVTHINKNHRNLLKGTFWRNRINYSH